MSRSVPVSLGWIVASAGAAALVALALLAPVVGGEMGAWMHHAFSLVCHQIPDRSPHLNGSPAALCHRCMGIAAGLAAGLLAAPAVAPAARQRIARGAQARWLAIAVIPTALDWLVGVLELWANTPASRSLTGAAFGLAAGLILASNLLASSPRAHPPSPALASNA